jgi:ribonuclease R
MKTAIPDDAALLDALRDSASHPMHVSDIGRRLGLPVSARHELSEALDALVSRNLVASMPGSRYRLPRARGTRVEGHFHQHPRGFAFVTPNDGGDDVFIPAASVLGAMHGDLVAALAQQGDRGREGVVTDVIARRPPLVPGTLRVRLRGVWVEPDDARIRGPLLCEDANGAGDGEAVLCEVTRWPEHAGEAPTGRVKEVLGAPGDLEVEVRKVILREGVDEGFPEEVRAEAARFPEDPPHEDHVGREDLRPLPLVTIDPDDARDHDDAVYVKRREDGGYIATVAIADVSHYVRPGTALDASALARGTSIYLPDRAIPMLPRELSSNLASLLPARDRLVLAVEAHLAADGAVESTRLFEGVMRSHARLTYTQAARALGWSEAPHGAPAVPDALRDDLRVAADLSGELRRRRLKRGALDLDLPEARVRMEEDGRTPAHVYQSRKDPGVRKAYNLIEELMLLANEAVAAICVAKAIPAVYRVHGKPDEELLARFAAVATLYGHKVDVEAGRAPRKLSALLRKVEGKPEARILGMLLLRAMPQARYASVNTGHFGLASEAYLHFTSPIRRYPDLIVHRVVRAIARNEIPDRSDAALDAAGRAAAQSSRLERRAMDVEREVLDLYRCAVAKLHVGEIHEATVTSVTPTGPFVEIEDPFLAGLLRMGGAATGEGGAEWQVDELGISCSHVVTGATFALGDQVTVELSDVAMARRMVYFRLPQEERDRLRRAQRQKSKSNPRGASKGNPRGQKKGGKKGGRR